MRTTLIGLGVAAAALALAAVVKADDPPAAVQMRVEAGPAEQGQPEVHIWINGQEVKSGGVITLGEGGVRIEPRAETGEPQRATRPQRERGAAGFLGVGVEPNERKGKRGAEGVVVTNVLPESPAAEAGIKAGDIITAIDGEEVRGPEQFVEHIRGLKAGDLVRLTLSREGERTEKTVRLAPRPEELAAPPAREPRPPEGKQEGRRPAERRAAEAWLGVMAAPLTKEVSEIAGVDHGVLIGGLTDSSPAAGAGLMPGDVVTAIDGKAVDSPEELVDHIRGHKPGDEVGIEYYRSGKHRTATVRLGERPGGPRAEEGAPSAEPPEELYRQMPMLRKYFDELRQYLQTQPGQRGEGARPGMPMPGMPQPPRLTPIPPEGPSRAPQPPSYDVGKDIGQILQRLDQLDRRLDLIDKRLDRLERK